MMRKLHSDATGFFEGMSFPMMSGFGVGAYHFERNILELAESGCQVGPQMMY